MTEPGVLLTCSRVKAPETVGMGHDLYDSFLLGKGCHRTGRRRPEVPVVPAFF